MNDPKKTCQMCSMEIPADARKCPFCQQYQNRFLMVFNHPGYHSVAVSILFAGVAVMIILMLHDVVSDGEQFQDYSDKIQTIDSEIRFGETERGATVSVMGTIRNSSGVNWEDIRFIVQFRNEEGDLIDVGQAYKYSYFFPANEETAFKISFTREFPEAEYVSHKVRVLYAEEAGAGFF